MEKDRLPEVLVKEEAPAREPEEAVVKGVAAAGDLPQAQAAGVYAPLAERR